MALRCCARTPEVRTCPGEPARAVHEYPTNATVDLAATAGAVRLILDGLSPARLGLTPAALRRIVLARPIQFSKSRRCPTGDPATKRTSAVAPTPNNRRQGNLLTLLQFRGPVNRKPAFASNCRRRRRPKSPGHYCSVVLSDLGARESGLLGDMRPPPPREG